MPDKGLSVCTKKNRKKIVKKKELSKLQQYVLCPLASIALTVVIYWQVHYISEIIKHL